MENTQRPHMVTSPFLLLLLFLFACSTGEGGSPDARAKDIVQIPLSVIIDSLGVSTSDLRITVVKEDRSLHVDAKGVRLKSYKVVLGGVPVGDKRMQGDRRTPEGSFTFRSKYPHRKWNKFIWIDYPNESSWQRFNERKAAGEIPKDADIGGEIGIHGVPPGLDHLVTQGVDWTLGCISMRNADLDEIYPFIANSTPLEIVP